MTIGVFKTKNEIPIETRVDNYTPRDGYGLIVNYRRTTYDDDGKRGFFGNGYCKSGDIIEMILDLNNMTLSYTVNEEQWGVAFSDIEQTTYRAVVSTNITQEAIELMSYQKLP